MNPRAYLDSRYKQITQKVLQLQFGFRLPSPLILLCFVVVGCGQPDGEMETTADPVEQEAAWFEEVGLAWGIDFVQSPGKVGQYFMPEINGSGGAVFDYDNDGKLDIYLIQCQGADDPAATAKNQLYRQVRLGHFENVSEGSGTDIVGRGIGVVAGDLNNDGWNDLLVTEYGNIRLLMNQGDGTFAEVTEQAALKNSEWGTSASFLDYDRDGWLDIVVANYVSYEVTRECFDRSGAREYCGPSGFPPSSPCLFRNLGASIALDGRVAPNDVKFEDTTVSSRLAAVQGPGLGVVAADFDGDRWPDILFADDAEANRLWINQQDGTFDEQAVRRGIAFNAMGQAQANMGVAVGDVDRDGLFDIFVTHLNTESHALWMQGPPGLFQDTSARYGVTRTRWRGTGFGTVFGDYDHDGHVDLAIANGSIKRADDAPDEGGTFWSAYAQRNQILRNTGAGRFEDRSETEAAFSNPARVSRGLIQADLDGDGSLDLLITDIADRARVYQNVAAQRGNWLMVRCIDDALGGRDCIGAKVTIEMGQAKSTSYANPSYSYLCSGDMRCHFGLGAEDTITAIEVDWPHAGIERFPAAAANQTITLCRGRGTEVTD